MIASEANKIYKEINKHLDRGELAQAFKALFTLTEEPALSRYRESLEDLFNTYKYLLHYFVEGAQDAKRNEIVDKIKSKLKEINIYANYTALLNCSSPEYFINAKDSLETGLSLQQLTDNFIQASKKVSISRISEIYSEKLQKDYQESVYQIFRKIWTTPLLNKEEQDLLSSIICRSDKESDESVNLPLLQSAIVIGCYLGCLQYYDVSKIKLLITAIINNADNHVLARSYVLLVFLLSQYKEETSSDKKLLSLLSLACDNDNFSKTYLCIVENYARCYDTARINNELQNEILPKFMKINPELKKALRDIEKPLGFDETSYEEKWEEVMRRYGLEDNMQKLNDMQLEGADMFMTTFAKHKQHPFFHTPANWLLPFYSAHTFVRNGIKRLPSQFVSVMINSPIFCDSDLYSFFLGLNMVPADYMNAMTGQFSEQLNMINEDVQKTLASASNQSLSIQINRFLKDLYRFYNQYYRASNYVSFNPFNKEIDFISLPVIGQFISNQEDLLALGNLYFKNKMWRECVSAFSKAESFYQGQLLILNNLPEDEKSEFMEYAEPGNELDKVFSSLFEKKGFALFQLKKYEEAKDAFLSAQMFQRPSVWLYKKIANCFYLLNEKDRYKQYLDKALEHDPDNKRLLLKKVHLCIDSNDFDEAIKILYKLYYLLPDNLNYRRILAWCRCLQGQAEKALEIYDAFSSDEKKSSDYLNMGHCHFSLAQLSQAQQNYMKYVELEGVDAFLKAMKEDKASLEMLKSNELNLRYLVDSVLIKMSSSQL